VEQERTLVEPVHNPASPVEERVLLGEAVEVDDEEEPDGALQQIHAQVAEGFLQYARPKGK
jgi:hypothetical protein